MEDTVEMSEILEDAEELERCVKLDFKVSDLECQARLPSFWSWASSSKDVVSIRTQDIFLSKHFVFF